MKRFVNKGQGPINFKLGGHPYSIRRGEEFTVPDKHASGVLTMGLPIEALDAPDEPDTPVAEYLTTAEFGRVVAQVEKGFTEKMGALSVALDAALARIEVLEKAAAEKVDPKGKGSKPQPNSPILSNPSPAAPTP